MPLLNFPIFKIVLIYMYLTSGSHNAYGRCVRKVATKPTCPQGWQEREGYCFKTTEQFMTWTNALAECDRIGGAMTTPNSPEEQAFFTSLSSEETWINCNDMQTEGKWVCNDGMTDISYRNWNVGEPNNFMGGQDCGIFFQGFWFDLECGAKRIAICKQHVS